ncbi:MAG: hypothetical protein AAB551_04425 [Patescibacteria group bacterium]
MKKILASFLLSVSLLSGIAVAAENFVHFEDFFSDPNNRFTLDIPSSWQRDMEVANKDFTEKSSKYDAGMSRYYFSKKSNFSMQLISMDYKWTYFPIEQNIFSESAPQYENLSDLCLKPGFIFGPQSWNTPGTISAVCTLQEIDAQQSFIIYEFLAYPEASGYGIVVSSFVKLFDGPYAGSIFSMPLQKVSKSLARLMPYESDEPAVYEKKFKRGKLAAEKYLKRLAKKSLSGIPAQDKVNLALFLRTITTFHEKES